MTGHTENARAATESTAGVEGSLVCTWHPNRETTLRCNRCGKPMCTSCAVPTPVGYRCKECVRGQQAKFVTAEWYDFAVGAGIGLIASAIAGVLLGILLRLIPGGFIGWIVVFFVAPSIGGAIAELVRRAVRGRRGRYLAHAVVGAIVIGGFAAFITLGLLFGLLYLFLAASTAYGRLRGISIG